MSGSMPSRLLCLLLSSLLVLACFSVGASAADEASGNLVDTDLTTWTKSAYTILTQYNSGIYRIYVDPPGSDSTTVDFNLYGVYDLPELTVGHTYTASLHFPSSSEINAALGTSFTDSDIISNLNTANVHVLFGIGYKKTSSITVVDEFSWTCSGPEFADYFGKTVSFDFDYSTKSDTGTPCFFIVIRKLNVDGTVNWVYVSNPVLKDNDADNTEGFFDNLIKFLTIQFGGISSSLTDLGTDLGGTISTKINELLEGLKTRLTEVTDNLSDDLFDAFDDMGIDLAGWFDDVGSWFESLKNSISQFFDDLWKKFSDFFEKFKPRVYEELYWERGMINVNTGAVLYPSVTSNVIVSEFFEVPLGTEYLVDFARDNSDGVFQIYQYDMNGVYIGSYGTYSSSFEEHILPQGYQYRFRLVLSTQRHESEANSAVMIYADEGWLNAFLHALIQRIQGLFLPDPYFINDWSEEMDLFLAEHLGIVYDAGTLTSDFITQLGNLFDSDDEIKITLPAVKFKLNDMDISLWEEQQVDMSFLTENEMFATFYGLYKMILWVIMIFATINHATRTFERILKV